MIQFNLLPDVKLEYLKARRSRRLLFGISGIAVVASLVILVSLLSVAALDKNHLSDLSKDIVTESRKLQNKPEINKILTVQNQLQTIGGLHNDKKAATRLFDYINQVTPAQADITTMSVSFLENTLTITGNADALSTINQYVDTLKFTTYSVDKDTAKTKAFSSVVLSSFGVTPSQGPAGSIPGIPTANSKKASYTISLLFDPVIFDITKTIKLDVPSQITTRSELKQPSELFSAPAVNSSPTPAAAGTLVPANIGGSR